MILTVHDPFPGRCRNYRTTTHGNGEIETLRCLDYENRPHVCEFPPGKPIMATTTSLHYTHREPEPWVRPGEEGDQR